MKIWIRVETDIFKHYKTRNLKRIIGCQTMREAASYPVALWAFAIEHAWKDQDLTEHGIDGVEDACEWKGKRGDLVKAFQTCGKKGGSGFLNAGTLIVHELGERSKRLVKYIEEKETVVKEKISEQENLKPLPPGIIELWNSFAEENALRREISCSASFETTEAQFKKALEAISTQPFLLGAGKSGWKVGLPWLMRPANYQKVAGSVYASPSYSKRAGPTNEEIDAKSVRILSSRGLK